MSIIQNRNYKSGQAERTNRKGKQTNLNDFIQLWPTPRNNSGMSIDKKHLSLDGAVTLWPTPRYGNPGSRPNKNGGKVLSEEGKKSKLPTPTVQDYKHRGSNSRQQGLADVVLNDKNNGQLNADWVEILMGYPLFWTDINKDTIFEKDLPAAWLDGTWEYGIPRVITDQKNRVKRLKCLGNAVVPQIPFFLWLLIKYKALI